MALPSWLYGPDFVQHYEELAKQLGKELALDCRLYEDHVVATHGRWVKALAEELKRKVIDPVNNPNDCVVLLGQLGAYLCRGRCVTYRSTQAKFVPQRLLGHQELLLRYSSEYLAALFIRGLHVDLYRKLRPEFRELRPNRPDSYDVAVMTVVCEKLDEDPAHMSKYKDLLRLPWISIG